ncbi:MAG: RNA polymerase sigma factor SigM [Actinomycetes bacterium]
MAAHADGDPGAFGEVVRRHRDRLWAVALRTLGDREEAADALQDALVSAFRASSGGGAAAFRGEAAVTTWLHRIVVNACLDRVRRRASRPADPLPEQDLPSRGPDPLATRELAIDLEQALATLPAEQRAALVLVDMYGWSVEDAAEVLDCAIGTVKSRCSRGRARLLPLLRPDGPGAAEGNPPDVGHVPPEDVPPGPAGIHGAVSTRPQAATSATSTQGGDLTR